MDSKNFIDAIFIGKGFVLVKKIGGFVFFNFYQFKNSSVYIYINYICEP
jgi:hypothetical protein